MTDISVKEVKIKNMIYEIRGKQFMLSSKLSAAQCHGHYEKIITHYDIVMPISIHKNNIYIGSERK